MNIAWVDMYNRDQRVLEWLRARALSPHQVSYEQLAREFQCHPNTAGAILRRLAGAGYIQVDKHAKRGGYYYSVKR